MGQVLLLAGWLSGATRLAAQSAGEREALARFRDSISAVTDETGLKQLETRLMLAAKRDRSNASRHLSLGWLALRLGESSDAAAEFKWATQLEPQWAAGWLGLGRAELRQGQEADTTRLGRRALLSRDAWARATQAFARAVGADPAVAGELEALVGQALEDSSVGRARVVRDGLRRGFASAKDRSAAVALALGRVERTLGDTTAALAAFTAAAKLPDGKGPGLLELARTRLERGDRVGIESYFDAVATDDSATVAAIRADLAWIASPAELARFDRLTGADRARFAWEFWTSRDRRDLRRNGERLAEHYRRLAVVRTAYPNPADKRAAVFVRHGEPDAKVTAELPATGAGAGPIPNESWWYRRPDGELVAHFIADPTGRYDLVESVFDLAPETDASSPAGDEHGPHQGERTESVLRSRAQLSPFYQAGAASRREQLATFRVKERAMSRKSLRALLTTDRFPLEYRRDLAARHELLALAADSGGGALHLFFSIPGFAAVPPDSSGGVVRYPIRVRLVAWDSTDRPARAIDSTLMIPAASPFAAEGTVSGHVEVPMPAGLYSVRFAIEAGESGSVGDRDGLRIGPVPTQLTLSDVMLATPGRGIPIRADTPNTDRVDPRGVFDRADTLLATTEVLGSAKGTAKVRALVRSAPTDDDPEPKWKSFPGGDRWSSVALTGIDWSVVRMALPLKRLKIGAYELEIVMVDDQGRTARNRATFEVE